jgi:predicted PurR-regulated permease PerM
MVIRTLNLNSATRWGLNLLALLGGVLALYLGQSIFVPTIIALLLAAMLWPLVRGMHTGLRFSWGFSCMLVVMGLVALNLFITLGFVVAIPKLMQDLPAPHDQEGQVRIYQRVREQLASISPVPLDEEYFPADAEKSRVFQYFQQTLRGPYVTDALLKTAYFINLFVWQWVLVMFILLFMLLEGPMLTRRVVEIFGPSERAQAHAIHALSDMALQVRTYLVWRTIINFGLALLVGIVYQWFGLKQPWTWAILTAILCYVPYLGPIAAGILPVVDAFVMVSPWVSLEILLFYVLVITLEGYVIVPVVMGRSMSLNATTVLLACLFWELVWGLPGLFLAMPLMAAVRAVCLNVPDLRPWANLMSISKIEIAAETPAAEEDSAADMEETQLLVDEKVESGERRGDHQPTRGVSEGSAIPR